MCVCVCVLDAILVSQEPFELATGVRVAQCLRGE